MSQGNTKDTDLSTEQQKSIINTKEVLASKEQVIRELGQIDAFEFMNKLASVATLKLMAKAKETKLYVGLTYKNEFNELATIATWDEFCTHKLGSPRRTIDDRLVNLSAFGEQFFEASQNIGLGVKDLRKLRQLPESQQLAVINSEEVDLGDKTAVKELIEDLVIQHNTEKIELTKQAEDVKTNLDVAREMSAEKDQELNSLKEQEAKRRFSQTPWKHQTIDIVKGLLEARVLIEQGINQLDGIFKHVTNVDTPLEQDALDYCGRTLLSEATNVNDLVNHLTDNVVGLLGTIYKPDLDAVDVLQELEIANQE
jgi:hypothetical protein